MLRAVDHEMALVEEGHVDHNDVMLETVPRWWWWGLGYWAFAPQTKFVFYPKCNRQILNNLKFKFSYGPIDC